MGALESLLVILLKKNQAVPCPAAMPNTGIENLVVEATGGPNPWPGPLHPSLPSSTCPLPW